MIGTQRAGSGCRRKRTVDALCRTARDRDPWCADGDSRRLHRRGVDVRCLAPCATIDPAVSIRRALSFSYLDRYASLIVGFGASVVISRLLTPAEVVKQHCAAEYQVFFMGFQPGFAYLGGLPEALATPRRAQPRTRVPAGSVGIGGSQTGVYPASSPGGWQLIGHTRLKLFDPTAAQPTLLQPGDRVRFVCEELRHA